MEVVVGNVGLQKEEKIDLVFLDRSFWKASPTTETHDDNYFYVETRLLWSVSMHNYEGELFWGKLLEFRNRPLVRRIRKNIFRRSSSQDNY